MTAPARKRPRRDARPPAESSVYDGGRLLAEIRPKAGAFAARLANGRALGSAFATERAAMRANCAADRRARLEAEARSDAEAPVTTDDPLSTERHRRALPSPRG